MLKGRISKRRGCKLKSYSGKNTVDIPKERQKAGRDPRTGEKVGRLERLTLKLT